MYSASCIGRDGKRIGSYQDGANLVSQMNCSNNYIPSKIKFNRNMKEKIILDCARDQKIFQEAGLGFTLSCSGNGNYYNVQGFNKRVFCVDQDGFPVTEYLNTSIGLDCNQYYYNKITEPLDSDEDDDK